jgi:hypothetical protein
MERSLSLLPESPSICPEWKRPITKHGVLGVKVHDTRLVAAMSVHGAGKILTFNIGDFSRFEIEAVQSSSVLQTTRQKARQYVCRRWKRSVPSTPRGACLSRAILPASSPGH